MFVLFIQGVNTILILMLFTSFQSLQDVFNLLPDVNVSEFVRSLTIKTNDQMLVVYLASLIRSVVALHTLIDNKVQNRDLEKQEGKEKKDDKEKNKEKDKDKNNDKDDKTGDKKDDKTKDKKEDKTKDKKDNKTKDSKDSKKDAKK